LENRTAEELHEKKISGDEDDDDDDDSLMMMMMMIHCRCFVFFDKSGCRGDVHDMGDIQRY